MINDEEEGGGGIAGTNSDWQATAKFIWTIKYFEHINKTIEIDFTLQWLGTKKWTIPKKTFLTV